MVANNQIRLSLQCLSYAQHGIYKGGYTSVWRTGRKMHKPSACVVFKPDANGELVRSHVVDVRKK